MEALAQRARRDLVTIKGLSDVKVEKLQLAAREMVPVGFTTASATLEQHQNRVRITTGCREVDDILEGGLEANTITEIYGESRTGKTQFCHTLAVTCQKSSEDGGGEGKCMYIDTEGNFRPQRLVAIAEAHGLDPEQVLDNVAYAKAHSTEHQNTLLTAAAGMMADCRFSLIIVDSATALYRTEYQGRGELSTRQVNLGRFLRQLQRLADEFGVAVVVTNQVVAANLDGASMFAGPSVKPIGGNIMPHATPTRLWFKKGRGENRVVKIISSPCLPERDAQFSITENGVGDAND